MKNATIVVGTNNLESGGIAYKPKRIIKHELYNQPFFANDIGIVKLDKIEFNEKVQPIKFSSNYVENGTVLRATGWGRFSVSTIHMSNCLFFQVIKKTLFLTQKTHNETSQFLKVVDLTAISFEKCRELNGGYVYRSTLCVVSAVGEGICNVSDRFFIEKSVL